MAIVVTIDDLNIHESLKTQPEVIAEVEKIIAQVKSVVFMYLESDAEAILNDEATAYFKQIVVWESETRFYNRNTETALKPPFANLFFSPEAYNLWQLYI